MFLVDTYQQSKSVLQSSFWKKKLRLQNATQVFYIRYTKGHRKVLKSGRAGGKNSNVVDIVCPL